MVIVCLCFFAESYKLKGQGPYIYSYFICFCFKVAKHGGRVWFYTEYVVLMKNKHKNITSIKIN